MYNIKYTIVSAFNIKVDWVINGQTTCIIACVTKNMVYGIFYDTRIARKGGTHRLYQTDSLSSSTLR